MHADGLLLAVDEDVRAVAHVTVPERAGTRGLPAQALLAITAAAQRLAVETAGREEPAYRRWRDGTRRDAAFEHEGVEDQLGGGAGIFAAHLAHELLLLGRERTRGALVGARLGA